MSRSSVIWDFTFYGEPVPKARAKAFYNPKTKMGWKYEPKSSREFSNAMKQAMARDWNAPPIEDRPIHLGIFMWKSRPKSLPKKIKFPIRRPDLDNYVKMVLDCLIGTVIKDDSIIVSMEASKGFVDRPHIQVALSYINTET